MTREEKNVGITENGKTQRGKKDIKTGGDESRWNSMARKNVGFRS